ncbi:MAG TPA: outer membrane lipoprotein carrier protein LolA [Saprospiraceae bacterium]|nr:outer membrane lipoprotein carrier protein LolA [Saprospiraceae bacterium]
MEKLLCINIEFLFRIQKIRLALLFPFTILFILPLVSHAQKASDSDPEARKILDKLKKEYDTHSSMEVTFEMVIKLNGQAEEKQKGKVIQNGNKYFVDLTDQAIYCNGEIIWLHLKDNHEVQINDMDSDDENFLTPREWITAYEKDDFFYAITNKSKVKNESFTEIEFKPLSNRTEYKKMRIRVNTTKNQMDTMDFFSRDGSQYSLQILGVQFNKKYEPALFTFDPSKFPGIHIEDLRL